MSLGPFGRCARVLTMVRNYTMVQRSACGTGGCQHNRVTRVESAKNYFVGASLPQSQLEPAALASFLIFKFKIYTGYYGYYD
jgi:hypothetical protein